MKTTVHRAVHDARSDYFHIGYEPIVVHANEIIRYHANPGDVTHVSGIKCHPSLRKGNLQVRLNPTGFRNCKFSSGVHSVPKSRTPGWETGEISYPVALSLVRAHVEL